MSNGKPSSSAYQKQKAISLKLLQQSLMFCFKPQHSSNTLQGLVHHLIGDLQAADGQGLKITPSDTPTTREATGPQMQIHQGRASAKEQWNRARTASYPR
ncbi:hypothetical protein NL676_007142 [Syzygium grande]|nr:hypothetical protein NL676_007142 [Syzygium grande]